MEARGPDSQPTYWDEFTDTFTPPEMVRDAPPDYAPNIGYLYRFWGHNRELLYVGQTLHPRKRMTMYARDPRWYPLIVDVT